MENKITKSLVIIGGGPAGLAAAVAAAENGLPAEDILILERDGRLGGILNQCIHNGFGLHTFREELTGPEYAARFLRRAEELGVAIRLSTMVLSLTNERVLTVTSRERGVEQLRGRAVILAMGCRERPRGALNIPGFRPAGIYTAGTAQRLVNMEGFLPGKEVVILGSGDIGLIMARRMTLEGAKVKAVAELMPYSGGLQRNIVQCLEDFDIPLLLSHTVIDIQGKDRVTGITLAQVGPDRKPIPGTEQNIPCDTLLLSCGLIPENELSTKLGVSLSPVTGGPLVNESLETNVPGVFACGNVLHVHDLVDYVSEEAGRAGKFAAEYIRQTAGDGAGTASAEQNLTTQADSGASSASAGQGSTGVKANNNAHNAAAADGSTGIPLIPSGGVRYTVPQSIRLSHMEDTLLVRFRVGSVFTDAVLTVTAGDTCLLRQKKKKLAPGEMQQIILKKSAIPADAQSITICVAKEEG